MTTTKGTPEGRQGAARRQPLRRSQKPATRQSEPKASDPALLAVYFDHPQWFEGLFQELGRRRIPFRKVNAQTFEADPAALEALPGLFVNRLGALPASSDPMGVIRQALQVLADQESRGRRVINGREAYQVGCSKVRQQDIVKRLGLLWPRSRKIDRSDQLMDAARDLTFPLLLKPNVGGSGADIRLISDVEALSLAARDPQLSLGVDGTAHLQEYHPAVDDRILRVEVLHERFFYAIEIPVSRDSFNYCPADGCGISETTIADPPLNLKQEACSILQAACADLGGVESLVSQRDGRRYYYDINPLSNFLADGAGRLGFDPTARFVDFLEANL